MIIVLSGKKGSGKDTTANYFINNYGFIRFAFADALKDICKILFDFSEDQLNGDKKEIIDTRYNITPRETFQFIGSLMRDNINKLIEGYGKNIWINILNNLLIKNKGKNIIITDLRYTNEYEYLNNLKALYNYKVYFFTIKRKQLSLNYTDHESEKDEFESISDYIINNNNTIDDLNIIIKEISDKILNN